MPLRHGPAPRPRLCHAARTEVEFLPTPLASAACARDRGCPAVRARHLFGESTMLDQPTGTAKSSPAASPAYAQADADIRALVEKTGIPYLPMAMAKGLLPDTHYQSASAARSYVLPEADVVMVNGAR